MKKNNKEKQIKNKSSIFFKILAIIDIILGLIGISGLIRIWSESFIEGIGIIIFMAIVLFAIIIVQGILILVNKMKLVLRILAILDILIGLVAFIGIVIQQTGTLLTFFFIGFLIAQGILVLVFLNKIKNEKNITLD